MRPAQHCFTTRLHRTLLVSTLLTLVLVLVSTTTPTLGFAASWTVFPDGTGDAPTIQAAIDAAAPGDTVSLADGTFTGPGNRDIDFGGKALLLQSVSGDAAACVLDLEGSPGTPRRGLLFASGEDSTTVVSGITIERAWTDTPGGALRVVGSSPRFTGVHVRQARGTSNGVAVYLLEDDLDPGASRIFDSCVFEGNDGPSIIEVGITDDERMPSVSFLGCEFLSNTGHVFTWDAYDVGDVLDGPEFRISGSTFADNVAGYCLWIWGGYHDLSILGTTFEDNEGGVRLVSDDELDFTETWTIGGCSFQGQTLTSVVAGYGQLLVDDCVFDSNAGRAVSVGGFGQHLISGSVFSANQPGGALSIVGGPTFPDVIGCEFQGNLAEHGGAVEIDAQLSRVRFFECQFVGNQAVADGGAIAVLDPSGDGAELYGCSFQENLAGGRGGAVYSTEDLQVSRSTFVENAASEGGAIWVRSDLSLESSTLFANAAASGSQVVMDSRLSVERSILAFGTGSGPAIVHGPGVLAEVSCTDIYGNGGGDWIGELSGLLGTDGNLSADPQFCDPEGGNVALAETSPCLEANMPADCGTIGAIDLPGCPEPPPPGAIRVHADGSGDYATIQEAIDAAPSGATILLSDGTYLGDGNRDLSFRGKVLTLRSNSGDAAACVIDCGGSPKTPHAAIVFDEGEGPSTLIRDLTITGAFTDSAPGAVRLVETNPTLAGVHFTGNTSVPPGAAIYVQCAPIIKPLSVESCTFSANLGPAAVHVEPTSSQDFVALDMRDCSFTGNEGNGFQMGGYFLDETGSFSFAGCSFEDNGGIGLRAIPAMLSVVDCRFARNEQGLRLEGGGDENNPCAIQSSWFEGHSGTAFSIWGAAGERIEVMDCDFVGNDGGGVEFAGGGQGIRFSGTRFLHNQRMEGGGAARLQDGGVEFSGCVFTDNHSPGSGGAIENADGVSVLLDGCVFDGNAADRGGAYGDTTGGLLTVEATTFVANSAALGEGAHLFLGSGAELDLSRTILVDGLGSALGTVGSVTLAVDCTDIYGNAGGDWAGAVEPFFGVDGNISADPEFCQPAIGDYLLAETSPCLDANMPAGCGTIGAFPEPGCEQPFAAVYLVRPDGSGDYPTIQAAVDVAAERDTVSLANGVFTGPGNRDVNFGGKAVVVRSESGDPSACVIDCEGTPSTPHRGFVFLSGEGPASVLENLTVRNGAAFGEGVARFGGAIYCAGASPTIRGCVFEGNVAERNGGAINLFDSVARIEGCILRGNEAPLGAGINASSSTPAIVATQITGNHAAEGGGGLRFFGQGAGLPVLSGSTVAANRSELGGGILCAAACSLDVSNTIVWDNCAIDGAALRLDAAGTHVTLRCSDVLVGEVSLASGATLDDTSGDNIALDPQLCGPVDCLTAPTLLGEFTLDAASPCLEGASACGRIGALGEGCEDVSGAPLSEAIPTHLHLGAGPNPFTDRLTLRIAAPAGPLGVTVYDVSGKRVRTLLREPRQSGGEHLIDWDGTSDTGAVVGSGVYFCRATTGEESRVERLVVLRK